jgi:hypothetical protein
MCIIGLEPGSSTWRSWSITGGPLPKHPGFQKPQQFQRVKQPSPSNGPSWRNCWVWAFSLAITVSPANRHDSKGIVPVLHQLAGFKGTALGDLIPEPISSDLWQSMENQPFPTLSVISDRLELSGIGISYRGERLSKAGKALGITVEPSADGGTFIPEGIRWVVERSLAWISRYRRLNTIFEQTEGHLVAFIEIAFISILSRRLVRLVTQEISA